MANKFLGVGADSKPGLYSKAESLSERASRIKAMCEAHYQTKRKTLEQAREIGKELLAAKDLCVIEGKEWLEWLKGTRIEARRAQQYMRVADKWDVLSRLSEFHSYTGLHEALIILGEPKSEGDQPPSSSPPNGKKTIRSARIPGDDRPEPVVKIDRAFGTINKTATEIIRFHDVPERKADALITNLRENIAELKSFTEAPERPFKKPYVTKCKDCGVDIQMTQTRKHGWIPLMPVPGGGNYEVVNNAASKVSFNRSDKSLYEMHHCPK